MNLFCLPMMCQRLFMRSIALPPVHWRIYYRIVIFNFIYFSVFDYLHFLCFQPFSLSKHSNWLNQHLISNIPFYWEYRGGFGGCGFLGDLRRTGSRISAPFSSPLHPQEGLRLSWGLRCPPFSIWLVRRSAAEGVVSLCSLQPLMLSTWVRLGCRGNRVSPFGSRTLLAALGFRCSGEGASFPPERARGAFKLSGVD